MKTLFALSSIVLIGCAASNSCLPASSSIDIQKCHTSTVRYSHHDASNQWIESRFYIDDKGIEYTITSVCTGGLSEICIDPITINTLECHDSIAIRRTMDDWNVSDTLRVKRDEHDICREIFELQY